MAKTITLSNTKLQSVVITSLTNKDGVPSGLASNINYVVCDDKGQDALFKNSQKYTSESEYTDEIMSEKAEKHLKAFMEEMRKLMVEREEL